MPSNKNNKLLHRNTTIAILVVLGTVAGCANMAPETREKLKSFAGTVLQLAAMNYTGPHQQMAESVMTLFNGSAVEEDQTYYDEDDPYGVYMDDTYDYGTMDAGVDDNMYQTAEYYPPGTPSIDAGLIGQAPDGSLQLLDNGVTLYGPSNGRQSDRVGVAFAPATDAYVYVVAFDGTGWTQALFPDPVMGHRNPVPAGAEVLIPGDQLYGLDNVPGVETIYVMASSSPRPDIEAQLAPFFGKERPPAAQAVYRSVERPIIISRGLTGLRPASVNAAALVQTTASTGSTESGAPVLNSFLAADGATELTVTLWFNHE